MTMSSEILFEGIANVACYPVKNDFAKETIISQGFNEAISRPYKRKENL